jgi:hypothetical protein
MPITPQERAAALEALDTITGDINYGDMAFRVFIANHVRTIRALLTEQGPEVVTVGEFEAMMVQTLGDSYGDDGLFLADMYPNGLKIVKEKP